MHSFIIPFYAIILKSWQKRRKQRKRGNLEIPEKSFIDALNNSYKKAPIEQADLDKFKKQLIILLDGIKENQNESEEHHKKRFADFLSKTWYDPDYYINSRERFDQVIHNGNKAQSTVGVIIEAKKPGKNPDMVSKSELNVKSMQQLLFYFLRETVTNKNNQVKHLIITNFTEWFIFDAREFYLYFLSNNKLKDDYDVFVNGLYKNDNKIFYSGAAFNAIEKVKKIIDYYYININDYEKLCTSDNREDDLKLINLYKFLSPQHLLKKPFANDNNSLNNNFYFELLYLLGLSEEKVDNKKIIVRNRKENQQNASLLENTISLLSDDISNVIEQFDIALELVITWINRILFLKLLEAQLINYQDNDKNYSFLKIETITDFSELNTLFFKVLAKDYKDRDEAIKIKYKNVPYLNSSLFDKTLTENRCNIASLQNGQIDYFSLTVLKDEKGNRRKGKINILEYIFNFLDAYNFSNVETELIKEKHKTIINASVLGLIFEKINGYKDGSYFTPGLVTSFICSKSIQNAILTKFRTIKNWKINTVNDLYNKIDKIEISEANIIINSIKILDPSVGSGHFLVSALNEIIAIKSFLGILVDKEGRVLRDYKISVENDELEITDRETGKAFEYNFNDDEKQRIQETIFNEKKMIIENSLFGVDINPNSVKICRLRLWIELLKNAYYKKESKYKELETLPNLELNIKCGNSLLSRFDIDIDISETIKNLDFTIAEYKEAVFQYKSSTKKSVKDDLNEKIEKIKKSFTAQVKNLGKNFLRKIEITGELINLKKSVNLFEFNDKRESENKRKIIRLEADLKDITEKMDLIEQNKIFENAFEWRLEFPEVLDNDGAFIGFDIILGNPPYIPAPKMVKNEPKMRKAIINSEKYKTLYQKWDLYIPFIELGLQMLSKNGVFTMIIPYPFTNQSYGKKLREHIISEYNLYAMVDLNGTKIFDNATVSNCIPFIDKSAKNDSFYIYNINDEGEIFCSFEQSYADLIQDNNTFVWNLTTEKRETSRYSDMNILGDFCYISKGMVLNADENTAKGEFAKNDLISDSYDDVHCRKYIEAKDIERYKVKKILYLEYNTPRCPDQLSRPTFRQLYENPKLMFNRLGNLMVYYDEKTHFLHSDSMFSAVLWKDLHKVNNKSITASIKRYSRLTRKEMEKLSSQIVLRYILGILNSKYASVLLTNLRGGDYHIYPEHLRNLPIPLVTAEKQQPVIDLVTQIIGLKKGKTSNDTTDLEKKLDKLVYKLYGLSKDEINTIEGV